MRCGMVFFIATAVPINKTLICGMISNGSKVYTFCSTSGVWRKRAGHNPEINRDGTIHVAIGNIVDIIYNILNPRSGILLTDVHRNDVCMFICYSLSLREKGWQRINEDHRLNERRHHV
jgi:hypothetical protein